MALKVLQAQHMASMIDFQDYSDAKMYIIEAMARSMIHELIPLMKITENDDEFNMTKIIRTSIVVGDTTDQNKFNKIVEDRAKEIAEEKISEILDKAINKIQTWGSYYGDSHIRKDEAIRFLGEAVRESHGKI